MKFIYLCSAIFTAVFISGCSVDNTSVEAKKSLRNSQIPFSRNAFISSIIEGDSEKVSLFLTAGIDTDIKQHNTNPLLVAVENNKQDIVVILLKHGVKIDPAGYSGTPLCVASEKGFTEIVKLLISHNADVNYLSGKKNALILASSAGRTEIITILLNAGANINIQGKSTCFYPLLLAAANGHKDAVKLLLEKHADPSLVDFGGKTALQHAIFHNRIKCAELLINDTSFNPEKDATSALISAIAMNRIPIVKTIISKNIDLNAKYGAMPLLSWAIANNHTDAAELLIKSGASTNTPDKEGMIPLDYALTAKNSKIIDILKTEKSSNKSHDFD